MIMDKEYLEIFMSLNDDEKYKRGKPHRITRDTFKPEKSEKQLSQSNKKHTIKPFLQKCMQII